MPLLKITQALATLLAAATVTCGAALARTETAATTSAATENHTVQIHRAEIAPTIYELAYSEKQHAVFVAAPAWPPSSQQKASKLLRLDPQTLAVEAEIELLHPGFGVTLDDAANRLYVGHGRAGFISVIDTAENRIIKTLPLAPNAGKTEGEDAFGYHVRALRLDASGQRLYVPGFSETDSVLFVIDTARLEIIKTIDGLGFQAVGVVVDDRHGRVFVASAHQGIKVVDAKRLEIIDTWETDTSIIYNLHYDALTNRLLGTDNGLLEEQYIPGFRKKFPHIPLRGTVARTIVVDAATGKELASLPAPKEGRPSLALQLDPQRKRLYVSNRGDHAQDETGRGSLSVFDSESHALLQTIPLPPHAQSLAFDAKNNVLYVSVKNDGKSREAGKLESVVRIQF